MKWFKHLTGALNDNLIFEAIERFGAEGYLVFFGTLEIMADEFDLKNPGVNRISIKKLTKNFQISARKLTKILQFFDKKAKENCEKKSFFVCFEKDNVVIKCNRLTELCDEYTQKEIKKNRDFVGTKSGITPVQEEEVEEEVEDKDKEESINTLSSLPSVPTPLCPHRKIISEYNRILGPYLPEVKPHLWKGKRAAYLSARWKERKPRQSIEWWTGFFEHIRDDCPFLIGKNDRKWTADLEWILKESNWVKILEGKYDIKRQAARGPVPGNGTGKPRVVDGVPSGSDPGEKPSPGPAAPPGGSGVEAAPIPLAGDS